MAGSQVNFGGFTFAPEELKDLREVIAEAVFNMRALSDNHVIEDGIQYDKQIVFSKRLGMFTKALKNDCSSNVAQPIDFTQKTWEPKKFDGRIIHCSPAVNDQNKLINQFARTNPDFFDVISGYPALAQFLITTVTQALQEELPWKIWHSDKLAKTIEDDGVYANTFDVTLVNTINGLWQQIESELDSTSPYYVEIAKNDGATYAAQALADNEGLSILRQMYEKADSRLVTMPGNIFYVTRTIYDNLLTSYEDRQANGGLLTRLENGGGLAFRGFEVRNMANEWDVFIKGFQNSGTAWHNPNRALFTNPANIPVGTLSTGDFDFLDAFYDRTDKINIIDSAYTLDTKFLEDYMAVAAY